MLLISIVSISDDDVPQILLQSRLSTQSFQSRKDDEDGPQIPN